MKGGNACRSEAVNEFDAERNVQVPRMPPASSADPSALSGAGAANSQDGTVFGV